MPAMQSRSDKRRSVTYLVIAEFAAMSLWFSAAAVLPDMVREVSLSAARQAMLASAVQGGFVIGALAIAISGIADRYDPRRVFALCALLAAATNALLLFVPVGHELAIALRAATGALLAGVYPVGMKIAVGWGQRDRGFLVGLLIGALTVGAASPHLISLLGGADWRPTIVVTSLLALAGAVIVLGTKLGPLHARAAAFRATAILTAWTDRRIRLAFFGYFGHMWELYVMWAWIGVALLPAYALQLAPQAAGDFAKLTAFCAIGIGGLSCVLAGVVADRIGKIEVATLAMVASGTAALATAATYGWAPWLTFVLVLFWGATVIADSAQFSAVVSDLAPPDLSGSLLTLQTALGFLLTCITIQLAPIAAATFGWPATLATLAAGPAFGVAAMLRLRALVAAPVTARSDVSS